MSITQTTTQTNPTIVDFSTHAGVEKQSRRSSRRPSSEARLADLIGAMNAAHREVGAAINAEEKLPKLPRPEIKILGGMKPASNLSIEGRPDIEIPASEWFYHDIEGIERNHRTRMAEATTDEERAAVQKRTDELTAEFKRQSRNIDRSIPKEHRTAERRVNAAWRAYERAERAILDYQPASLQEAHALLLYASQTGRGAVFSPDPDSFRDLMQNVADCIKKFSAA